MKNLIFPVSRVFEAGVNGKGVEFMDFVFHLILNLMENSLSGIKLSTYF